MNWQEVIKHPSLQNLPFKIELNEKGEIVMNPVKVNHSIYQGEIAALMRSMREGGMVLAECAVWTKKGTKVADVAWASKQTLKVIKDQTECSIAPEVCVEVISYSNTDKEIRGKRKLYFDRGAKEVWICNKYGEITFYNPKRKLKKSELFPNFPLKIEI